MRNCIKTKHIASLIFFLIFLDCISLKSEALDLLRIFAPGMTKEARRAKSGERYFEPNPSYPPAGTGQGPPGSKHALEWITTGYVYTNTEDCVRNEERVVYWPPRHIKEKRFVKCDTRKINEIRNEIKKREEKQYAASLERCSKRIREKHGGSVGEYINQLVSNSCKIYAKKGTYPANHTSLIQELEEKYSKRQIEQSNRIAKLRQERLEKYKKALEKEKKRNKTLRSSNKIRHFYYDLTADREYPVVVAFEVPVKSMQGGRTLGGSNIVDMNTRTYVNGSSDGEQRVRIFCSEGKHKWISGSSYSISGDMGRWACARYGYYHPSRR